MILSRNLRIAFGPWFEGHSVPHREIMDRWIAADFKRPECRKALEEIIANRGLPESYFSPERIEDGGNPCNDPVIHPTIGRWGIDLRLRGRRDLRVSTPLTPAQAPAFAEVLRFAFASDSPKEIKAQLASFGAEFVEHMIDENAARGIQWGPSARPGIYRREHASLVFRSETSSILLDPIPLCRSLPGIAESPLDLPEELDGVLISHGHGDHLHFPSLLHVTAGQPDLPVVVPAVSRTSTLTPYAFGPTLEQIGINALTPAWGETIRLGDIEVDILPFYGEQPTRDAPGPAPGLRSWGNCFRINTPTYSAIVLVDSGADPDGDMKEVVRESVRKRGPATAVLSCLRTFESPFFGGLATYWPSLSFARLEELFQQYRERTLPSTTAGPEGAAEICRIAEAKYFLPYAHGFQGVGKPIDDIGWSENEPSEASVLERMRALLALEKTKVLDWNCGDLFRMDGPDAAIERAWETRQN